MTTDEEKSKLAKLLIGLKIPEVKLSARCNQVIKEFREKYQDDMDDEQLQNETYTNPYVPDEELLRENERKLKELLAESKRTKKMLIADINLTATDPKRPWRTHTNREKLLRIENELKQHRENAAIAIKPLEETKMCDLINECREESKIAPPVGVERLRETVDEAMRNLPNFMYKIIPNTTAILAHPTTKVTNTIDEIH